jgi:hypothetical protein
MGKRQSIIKVALSVVRWGLFCGVIIFILQSQLFFSSETRARLSFLVPPLVIFGVLHLTRSILPIFLRGWQWELAGMGIRVLAWLALILLILEDKNLVDLSAGTGFFENLVSELIKIRGYLALGIFGIFVLNMARLFDTAKLLTKFRPVFILSGFLILGISIWGATDFLQESVIGHFFRVALATSLILRGLVPLLEYASKSQWEFINFVAEKLSSNPFISVFLLATVGSYLFTLRATIYQEIALYPIWEWLAVCLLMWGLYAITRNHIDLSTTNLEFISWKMHQQVIEQKRDDWYEYLTKVQENFILEGLKSPITSHLIILQDNLGFKSEKIRTNILPIVDYKDRYPPTKIYYHIYYQWDRHLKTAIQRQQTIQSHFAWRQRSLIRRGEESRKHLLDTAITAIQETREEKHWKSNVTSQNGDNSLSQAIQLFISNEDRAHLTVELTILLGELNTTYLQTEEIISSLISYRDNKTPWYMIFRSKNYIQQWHMDNREQFLIYITRKHPRLKEIIRQWREKDGK